MEFLLYAVIGGLLPDVIRLVKNRHGSAPEYLKKPFFYISLLLMVGLGILAVYLKEPGDKIEALSIGFGAPQIISSLLGSKLNKPSDTDDGPASFRAEGDAERSQGLVQFLRSWW